MTTTLKFNEFPPGLNGRKGLMRMHWSARTKLVNKYCWLIKAQRYRKHKGEVVIFYRRFSRRLMDWDNYVASFKIIGDALVKCGVITDDSPGVIKIFIPQQVQIEKGDEQELQVQITDQ